MALPIGPLSPLELRTGNAPNLKTLAGSASATVLGKKELAGKRSTSLTSLTKAQVEPFGSPTAADIARPSSRGATTRRRPAPKAIVEGAVQIGVSPSPLGEDSRARIFAELRTPLARREKVPQGPSSGYVNTFPAQMPLSPSASPLSPKKSPKAGRAAHCTEANLQCTITTEQDGSNEIRTKVFRIGAPLLRSTIPVSLGGYAKDPKRGMEVPVVANAVDDDDGSDVETVLSLSECGAEDQGQISVTLDFPV